MAITQNVNPANLRVDYAMADRWLRPEPPKLTFWQKMGRGLASFMQFAGPVGAALAPVLMGPLGIPVAAGCYGLTKFSGDQLYKAQAKDAIDMASQQQAGPITMPGLFESPAMSAGDQATDFMIESNSPMAPAIGEVVVNRNDAESEALTNF